MLKPKKMKLANKEIVKGIGSDDAVIINTLFTNVFPLVKGMILSNSGNYQDAEDVYHEAFMAVYTRLKTNGIQLTVPFHHYFLSICRNIWLKRIRSHKLVYGSLQGYEELCQEQVYSFHGEQNALKASLLMEHIQKLDAESRKVIELFMENMSFKHIAKKMNYGNEQRAIKKKYTAKKQLMRSLSGHPLFKELSEN